MILVPAIEARRLENPSNVYWEPNVVANTAGGIRGERRSSPLDVVIAADFCRGGDFAFRLAQEIRHHATIGQCVGLVQATEPDGDATISTEIQTCVRRGLATPIEPAARIDAGTLVVHAPGSFDWDYSNLARISAHTAAIVCHSRADIAIRQVAEWIGTRDRVFWTATTTELRRAPSGDRGFHRTTWLPPIAATFPRRRAGATGPKTVGWITGAGLDHPDNPEADSLRVVALSLERTDQDGPAHGEDHCISVSDVSLDRLVTKLDAICCFPDSDDVDIPETLIWSAADAGRVVMLPNRFRRRFGKAALYGKPTTVLGRFQKLFRDSKALAQHCKEARAAARARFGGPECHPIFTKQTRRRRPASSNSITRPALFLPSNGVGLGHVSRLLAIAKRLDPVRPVLFATQAQAAGVIESFGFAAEYIPSATYVRGDFEAWDAWFGYEVGRIVDAYDPAIIVYDGNNPSDGLIRAVAGRRDCRLAWIRRGLWGNTVSPYLRNARWCDVVIEPGELENQPDNGTTADRRHEVLPVSPIRLLDPGDLLPRLDAAAALGLDPNKPAVLVQLGAGYNRDIISLIDCLIGEFRRYPDLQIAIAEWVNAAHSINLWPGVKYLRGFPLSQYFNAFDFSVSAAGYNTFHEVLNLGLPTVFVPNRHPAMDDQAGRAEFAQSLGAAFEICENDLSDLPDLIALMMQPRAREYLVERGRGLAQPNGAEAAATALAKIMESAQ